MWRNEDGVFGTDSLVFVELRDTVIHEAVATRFGDLRSSTQKPMEGDLEQFVVAPDGAPAVHIASSVCGGTGAGMLIDMAYNLRWWSRESFPRNGEIIGHLMLPEAFSVDPMLRPKLEAVAGATLEQIEFLSDSDREDVDVRYKHEECKFGAMTPPLNFLYLLNGRGDTGVGNRSHLSRMIARVIRAMVIEPSAQHVTSDANNKLNDILGLMDPANGRRQCFASYGFWYGKPGHRQTDVESWMCSALEAMGSGPTVGHTDYAHAVQQKLAPYRDLSARAEALGLERSFDWSLPSNVNDAQVVADIFAHLKVYLKETAVPGLQAQADEDARTLKQDFLDTADKQIEHDVCRDAAPLGQVGVCLRQWEEQLEREVTAHRAADTVDFVKQRIMTAAQKGLKDLRSRRPSPQTWTPHDVVPVIERAVESERRALAEAVLRKSLSESMERTLEVFRVRKHALSAMISAASGRHLTDVTTGTTADGDGQAVDELFATPLYAAADPLGDSASYLTRQFRQKLIRPILRDVLFSIKKEDEDAAADIDQVRDKLRRTVGGLQKEREKFLKEAESKKSSEFHSHVPPDEPIPDHNYYKPVCDVLRLAEPKIDLSRRGVFANWLDVGITQQVSRTCVPQLLGYNVGATFREAHVTENYEEREKAYFQLLRLRYGFCLEAISTYHRYVEAANEYVARRRFSYSDTWLDHRWYISYRSALKRWAEKTGNLQSDDRMDKPMYDAIAETIGKARHLVRRNLAILLKAIRSMTDMDKAIDAARVYERTQAEIMAILENLQPSKHEHVKDGIALAMKRLDEYIGSLEATRNALPEPDRSPLSKALQECRRELAAYSKRAAAGDADGSTGAAS